MADMGPVLTSSADASRVVLAYRTFRFPNIRILSSTPTAEPGVYIVEAVTVGHTKQSYRVSGDTMDQVSEID